MKKNLSILLLAISMLFSAAVTSAFEVTPGMTGAWFDPSHNGEGYVVQVIDDSRALVYWFTYDAAGNQFWMLGVGDVVGSKITVNSMDSHKGPKFGPGFDPGDVVRTRWGTLELDFNSCNTGIANYSGPGGFGSGSLNIERINSIWGLDCSGHQQPLTQTGEGLLKSGFTGAWFDPAHNGEGFVVQVIDSARALVYWFTYDPQGNPAWMVAVADIFGSNLVVNNFDQPYGAKFGTGFNNADVVHVSWGQAVFSFGTCGSGGMRYVGPESYGPESTQIIQPIVGVKGTECGFFGGLHKASGNMNVAENTYMDGDTNDINSPLVPNNGNDVWQDIFTPAYVAGFATADPTGEPGQRFENESDEGDLYRISLREGEKVSLEIAKPDPSNDGGDLDLWLYDVNKTDDPVDSSLGPGNAHTVRAPSTGDYYLWVWAHEGKSNYTLRTGWDVATEANTLTVNADMVADQVVVRYLPLSISSRGSTSGQIAAKFAFDDFNDEMKLTRISSDQSGSALYEINAPYVNMQSAYEFPLKKYGFGIRDHRKWVAVLTAKKLLAEKNVQFAGPNYIAQSLTIPNDTFYHYQWHYKLIDLEKAWNVTTGSKDVVVAVIDSGVADVHDLEGNVDYSLGVDFVPNSVFVPSGDGDGPDWDARDPGPQTVSPSMWMSHGTHVAGTIGAMTNNGIGVAGVNWDVTIMPIRVFAPLGLTSCDFVEQALRWAGQLPNVTGFLPSRRADIINMSLGFPTPCPGHQSLINELRNVGVTIIAAAGNCGFEPSCTREQYMYPASFDNVISVSATNRVDELTRYSNYGSKIDITAPGGSLDEDLDSDGFPDAILSTTIVRDANSNRTYRSDIHPSQGTSMAAPHVAGVAALMKSVFPEMTATDFDYALSSGEITDDLVRNGATSKDNHFGYGRINAQKAVNWALNASSPGQRETFITSSSSALDFGSSETGLLIDVGKSGPANIKAQTWYREDEWFSLEPVETDESAFGVYRVTVNRTGLSRGQYRSTLWLEADNGTVVRVSINLQVGESVVGEAGQQYAALLDAYTLVPQYWWGGKQQPVDYNVKFEGVVPGLYYLLVGSDMDGDRFICDEGEFCQIYPIDSDPKLIEITSEDYSLGSFTISIPNPKLSSTQASAVLVDENGTVEETSDAFKDFSGRYGKSGWKIEQ